MSGRMAKKERKEIRERLDSAMEEMAEPFSELNDEIDILKKIISLLANSLTDGGDELLLKLQTPRKMNLKIENGFLKINLMEVLHENTGQNKGDGEDENQSISN